jgi:hypothetical protein
VKEVSCTTGSDLRISVAMLLCNKFPLPFDALIEFLLCYKLDKYQEVFRIHERVADRECWLGHAGSL